MKPSDSNAPFKVSEDTQWKMSTKTLLAIIGFVVVAAASWFNIKADVTTHGDQMKTMQAAIADDHDQLKVQGALLQQQASMLERIDRKIDRLTYGRNVGGGGGGSNPNP